MGLVYWSLVFANLLAFSAVSGDSTSSTTLSTSLDDQTQTFIIRVQNDLKPSAFSDVEHWYSSTLRSLTSNVLSASSESTDPKTNQGAENKKKNKDFLHVYRTVFHGFSTKLTQQQAEEIKTRPGVLGVYQDRIRQIQTTRSPQFLGLTPHGPNANGLLTGSDYGSNVVIGIFDTGIWPERRSFHDRGLGPVPSHWKGECMEGKGFSKTLCNKKLVGARYFPDGYTATAGGINDTTEFRSPRDSDGHGTHTASTAAGRHVRQASMLGFAEGVAVGIAPKARIAVYKVCWERGCFDSDILAAFDKAVEDGVDVISLSVGAGAVPYYLDPIAMGAFGAMEKGVLISASAGNEGPGLMTVTNIAPWITTVGAGTMDRRFPADLILEDGRVIRGASLYNGAPLPEKTFLPLVYAGNLSVARNETSPKRSGGFTSAICMPKSLDPELVRGKIVLCDRGGVPRVSKGAVVKEAGGAGMIVANVAPDGEGLVADAHVLPGVAITESAGYTVHGYIATSKNPRATFVFRGTQLGIKPAPIVAGFSSRGPNLESIHIIKPDIIAPGVDILAAWPDGVSPTGLSSDPRRTEFNIMSGTSMSCPHVSGLAALLKGAHPDWSPARIRSALMTTAYMHDSTGKTLLDESTYNTSTVWDMGSGHVDPEKAINPGLVYDLTVEDYLDFLCASNYSRRNIRLIARRPVKCTMKGLKPWNLNYPSISVAVDQSEPSKFEIAVTRTATHVGDGASSYTVKIDNPVGAIVTVDPPKLDFNQKEEKRSYVVKITAEKVNLPPANTKSEFGRLTWSDGKHVVSMPVAVTWQQSY
ncbi:Peptidase S8/S53 domain [Macleaya cordata]|uniref:Peptidase S8/S53 domain n=1 Tax=Macleaya cordata TaxID=56857 RepID=A0A200PWN5_MACCD|nr:Peptidase S8/S53 domain [Macleaya cordata]